MNAQIKYSCPKCGAVSSTTMKLWVSGSFFARIFDIQNKKFNAVICSSCRYTEFYHAPSRKKIEL